MTTTSTIPIALLSNVRLLRHLLLQPLDATPPPPAGADSGRGQAEDAYKFYARREFQLAFLHRDNEIFRSRWKYFCDSNTYSEGQPPVLASLDTLYTKYMEVRNGELHIRLERFSEWQNVIANINFQPIVAYAMHRLRPLAECGLCRAPEDPRGWRQSLFYPYDIAVEDYIDCHGLNDSHLHINACAYAEYGWLYALSDPLRAYRHLMERLPGRELPIYQQFLEIYEERSTETLFRHLVIARNIRIILRHHTEFPPRYDGGRYMGRALSFLEQGLHTGSRVEELATINLISELDTPDWNECRFSHIIHGERLWMSRLIDDLASGKNDDGKRWLIGLFHIYILLMNEFSGLFIMKESQKGFNQFDHSQQVPNYITWHRHYYQECFHHFHGEGTQSITHYLDARLAPKATAKDNYENLCPILKGYRRYLQWAARNSYVPLDDQGEAIDIRETIRDILRLQRQIHTRHIRLSLTAHFIKEHWEWSSTDDYRHHSYREKLRLHREALRKTFSDMPGISQFLRAVDAANDEHHIPPSVFAPTFRYCKDWMGMDNITFHCGEDFPHLLTGLRTLHDAYQCFDMRHGDRIGHATALGIAPELWFKHVPRYLYVRREDRMLDLLLAFRILKHDSSVDAHAICEIHDELLTLAHQLFDTCVPSFDLADLESGMKLRKLAPETLIKLFRQDADNFDGLIRQYKREAPPRAMAPSPIGYKEWEYTHGALAEATARGIELAMAWFTQEDIWQRGNEMIEIEVKRRHIPLFFKVQRYLMKEFFDKGIVIETLPSSNLRIACYHHAREHHSMRWLLRHGDFADDPKVLLAFGSDDPGVFSCDAKSEFYLLYDCLRDHDVTEQDAIRILDEMNQRGRIYAFNRTNTWRPG